jgi:imidazolonepropionase-like amidohydrolase
MRPLRAALVLLLLARAAAAADGFVLVGATVVDESGVVTDAIVVVAKGRVESMGPRADVRLPKGLPIQDGRGLYVVAGPPWANASAGSVRARISAGASPRDALVAALCDRAASLRAGAAAHFVVLDRDPLADPANLGAVVRAVRDGRELSVEQRGAAER